MEVDTADHTDDHTTSHKNRGCARFSIDNRNNSNSKHALYTEF